MTKDIEKPTHFWYFDENRRVYANRSAFTSPIWREHWRKAEVVGETSRSWVVGRGYGSTKIPKKGPLPRGWARSEAEVDERCWEHEHRHRIQQQLNWMDVGVLRQVAQLIGYPH